MLKAGSTLVSGKDRRKEMHTQKYWNEYRVDFCRRPSLGFRILKELQKLLNGQIYGVLGADWKFSWKYRTFQFRNEVFPGENLLK